MSDSCDDGDVDSLIEKPTYVSGVCLTAGEPQNGRVYTKEAMEKAVSEWNEKDYTKYGGMISSYIIGPHCGLRDITHEVEELKIDGDDIRATCRVLGTPKGGKLKQLLEFVEFKPLLVSVGYLGSDDFVIAAVAVGPVPAAENN